MRCRKLIRRLLLLVDAVPHDEEREELPIAKNVHCVLFHEEQAGYLAGYMAVWEGYRNLGFIGGREEPAVQRYGYGYLQGINAAAKDLSLTDVVVNYWYAGTYAADAAVREKADGWYGNGTQIILPAAAVCMSPCWKRRKIGTA